MTDPDDIRPLPANTDNKSPRFDGEKIADAYRQRRVQEPATAPMETDGEAGGARNRPGVSPGATARPRPDLPPTQQGAERDRILPRKGRSTFLIWIGVGLAVAIIGALLAAG